MGVFEGEEQYHYTALDSKYLTTYQIRNSGEYDLISVSSSLRRDPQTKKVKIYILHALLRETWADDSIQDTFLIWQTYNDLSYSRNNWRRYPTQMALDGQIAPQEQVLIRINPVKMKPVILYLSYKNSKSADETTELRLLDHNGIPLAKFQRAVNYFNHYDAPYVDIDPYLFNPQINITKEGCLLTFQAYYKTLIGNNSLYFDYIFGKYISFANPPNDKTSSFLVSTGRPEARKNKGIVLLETSNKAVCYWDSAAMNNIANNFTYTSMALTERMPRYNPNLDISNDPMPNRINFKWDGYLVQRASDNTDNPQYTVYILTPDLYHPISAVSPPRQGETTAYWDNLNNYDSIISFLCVTGVSNPRLSNPKVFNIRRTRF